MTRKAHSTDSAVRFVIDSVLDAYDANGAEGLDHVDMYLAHLDEEDTSRANMTKVRERVSAWLAKEGHKLTVDTPLHDFERAA